MCLCFSCLYTLKSVWKNYKYVQKKLIKNAFHFIIWIADVLIEVDIKYLHVDIKSMSLKYCKPTFICVWEIFAKFVRALSPQIFLATNQF